MTNKLKSFLLISGVLLIGFSLRLYHLNFGLPHTFYADEPEFTELAIKYTYQIRNIIRNGDYFELIPISYVYGTVPTYFLTLCLMIFSKTLNIFNIGFDKYTIFVFFRVLIVFISMGVIWVTVSLAKSTAPRQSSNQLATLFTLVLVAINYKLIVHAHYVNADIILTLLLGLSFYFFYRYLPKPDNLNLFLSAFFLGLAVGTKVTALISLPIFLWLVVKKRDLYGVAGFITSAILAFIITNPFSLVFFGDFSFRIYAMLTKEGGMVFDSVNYSPLKYVVGLIDMVSLPIVLLFLYEILQRIRRKTFGDFDAFLVVQFIVYLAFFSIQSRRVDRWLLPMLPVVLLYAGHGLTRLYLALEKVYLKIGLIALVFATYAVKPTLLLTQFQRWTPKAQAYIWSEENLPETATKLAYTEEGLDPLNKLGMATVVQFNVYESDGAQLFYPTDPLLYDYVILSSRPMENFKRNAVTAKYPDYSATWLDFETTINDPTKFELIKDFTLSKPNLIPLSDVFVYKRL